MGSCTSPYGHVSVRSYFCNEGASNKFRKSLLELQIGILVACMPAMSHTCRYLLPSYETLKSTLLRSHYFGALSSTRLKRSKTNEESFTGMVDQHSRAPKRSDYPTHKGFHEIRDGPEKGDLAVPGNSLHTYIHRGSVTDIKHDGINLTYEMQQSVR